MELFCDKQNSPVFQAVQKNSLDDDKNLETVINEWLMEMRKQEENFLENAYRS